MSFFLPICPYWVDAHVGYTNSMYKERISHPFALAVLHLFLVYLVVVALGLLGLVCNIVWVFITNDPYLLHTLLTHISNLVIWPLWLGLATLGSARLIKRHISI
jgi:hypothetical protein